MPTSLIHSSYLFTYKLEKSMSRRKVADSELMFFNITCASERGINYRMSFWSFRVQQQCILK